MLLMLMRHADAESFDVASYASDDLRPLTKLGIEVQTKVAEGLWRMGCKPDRIITSPRLRAVQTATITAEGLDFDQPLMESDVLGQDYSVTAALAMLENFKDDESILCVGHDPDLTELAAVLLGITSHLGIKFPKSGVLGIELSGIPTPNTGELRFFYRPQDLLALL